MNTHLPISMTAVDYGMLELFGVGQRKAVETFTLLEMALAFEYKLSAF